jgi:hypothetical protein
MALSDDVLHAWLSGNKDGIKDHPDFDQQMTAYCKKVVAHGPTFTEKAHPWFRGVTYRAEDPLWGLARQYLRAHDTLLTNSTLNMYGPKSHHRNSIGAQRTIPDADLWYWLSISDRSVDKMTPREQDSYQDIGTRLDRSVELPQPMTQRERDFYQDIITKPEFYENSISFCEELLAIVEREHEYGFTIGDLGGQEGYIIDDWNRAKNYLEAQTTIKSALEADEY